VQASKWVRMIGGEESSMKMIFYACKAKMQSDGMRHSTFTGKQIKK
jgi:hypothetical protein